ncbi:hypothetical protein M2D07_027900 [Pseudomonas sp. BGr12]|uniref:DUF4175 domain-containing protein n=1 Tax=Pseudomonas nitroreducens TaxID=46680 RepID=A0A5R8ZU10_PSENT|nr:MULTISPECIES: hypothetical protein [Pseudomonas]MBD9500675.1 hypothetical protein [Pseudomonas sp. PDM17]MBD9516122.1 hypothetical protein [Pseudomonas sp. PDM22]MBD9577623.1 hypothetical protein [Pseudomonas sp. PDM23]MBD9672183.1 hypothetical protein [Pseudomonas sp. PDM21]MBD9684127.1 hypothetical protein [Pseudomonas sp. PDM20]
MRRGLWMIFRWPVALAVLSTFGLLSALLGDGVFDLLSWISLGVPLLLIVFVWMRMPRRPKEPR